MKRTLLALALLSATAFAYEDDYPEVPPIDGWEPPPPVVVVTPPPYPNDLPRAGFPLSEPPYPVVNYHLPKRVTWTANGSSFLISYAREVCRAPDSHIRCASVTQLAASQYYDWGMRIYRKDTGAYLGTIDRNTGEEITRDSDAFDIDAENRHPESAWVAAREAEKAKLEYIAAACASGGVYCTGMASKLPDKFKMLFDASCSLFTGVCVAKVTNMKLELQQKIDNVKAACATNDQACFDAVTNGGETQARAQRALEKSLGKGTGGSGERPPHTGRPSTFGEGDPMAYYDPSCKHCTIDEYDDPEKY